MVPKISLYLSIFWPSFWISVYSAGVSESLINKKIILTAISECWILKTITYKSHSWCGIGYKLGQKFVWMSIEMLYVALLKRTVLCPNWACSSMRLRQAVIFIDISCSKNAAPVRTAGSTKLERKIIKQTLYMYVQKYNARKT